MVTCTNTRWANSGTTSSVTDRLVAGSYGSGEGAGGSTYINSGYQESISMNDFSHTIQIAFTNPRHRLQVGSTTTILTTDANYVYGADEATGGLMSWGSFNYDQLEYDLESDDSYIYYEGEMVKVTSSFITEKDFDIKAIKENKIKKATSSFITEKDFDIKAIKENKIKKARIEKIRIIKEKRIQIRLGRAETKGLGLLEKMINENQMKSYMEGNFIDVKDSKGNICRIFKNDSKQIEVYEKKPKLSIVKNIKEALTTSQKLNKMDEFVVNGESFILKKKVCTHHKAQNMPDVDGVISKIIHLRAGIDYKQFGNVSQAGNSNRPITIDGNLTVTGVAA